MSKKSHSRTQTAFLLLSTLLVVLFVTACGSGGGSKTEARITVSGGGELRSEDGSFVLSVPPNAVSEDVTISLEEISPEDAEDGILNAEGLRFELKPDGLQFSEPAKVTLTVPVEELDTGAENEQLPTFNLVTVSSGGDISGLENLDNSFDLATNELSVSADVSHFSTIVRTKRDFTVKLTRITAALALGEPRVIDAEVDANTPSVNHSLDWRLEALSNVRLDPPVTRAVQVNQVQRDVQFTSESARASGNGTLLESESFNNLSVSTNLICTGLGTGIYSFSMTATPMREGITAVNLRPVRISITASVTCIGVAEAAATARTSIDETVRAGGADLVFTPTPAPPSFVASPTPTASPVPTEAPTTVPVPTATPRPTQAPAPTTTPRTGDIQLRVIASTGDIVPGPDLDSFTSFELPQSGGEGGIFYAFNQSGATGIWSFDRSSGDTRLTPIVTTTSPPENDSFVFLNSESFVANGAGDVVYIGRLRIDNDFTDGVFLVSDSGAREIALEGMDAPGAGEGAQFRQFNTARVTANGSVLFESPVSGDAFWFRPANGAIRNVLTEGDALPGLGAGWRDTGSRRMVSSGVTDDGTVLFFLADYRRTLQGGAEETGGGIWVLKPGGNELVAQTGMQAPDLTIFTDVFDPSMNASGQVAFHARSEIQIGNELINNDAIWKTDGNGGLVKVAEPMIIVGPDNVELVGVSQPIIQPDGSVIFVGTAFDDTNSVISFVLKETATGLEILARTDALPGPNGPVSVVPNTIGQIATNGHGAVLFQVGFLGDVWMRSPDGSFDRIIGAGEMLSVESAGGTVQKTVSFVEFVGGAATDMGLPTGFSDDFDMVMKVTFFDGTEAVVQATVFDELFD